MVPMPSTKYLPWWARGSLWGSCSLLWGWRLFCGPVRRWASWVVRLVLHIWDEGPALPGSCWRPRRPPERSQVCKPWTWCGYPYVLVRGRMLKGAGCRLLRPTPLAVIVSISALWWDPFPVGLAVAPPLETLYFSPSPIMTVSKVLMSAMAVLLHVFTVKLALLHFKRSSRSVMTDTSSNFVGCLLKRIQWSGMVHIINRRLVDPLVPRHIAVTVN